MNDWRFLGASLEKDDTPQDPCQFQCVDCVMANVEWRQSSINQVRKTILQVLVSSRTTFIL